MGKLQEEERRKDASISHRFMAHSPQRGELSGVASAKSEEEAEE
jgi:hypothetical protein